MDDNIRNTIYYSTENINDQFSDCNLSEDVLTDEPVHFVLVHKTLENINNNNKRLYYEAKLQEVGLVLSTEQCDNLKFVKIFAPNDVLCRYCEIMKMRMPIKMIPGLNVPERRPRNKMVKAAKYLSNLIDENFAANFDKKYKWTAEFSSNKEYLFDTESKNFFPSSVKCLIVHFILERGKFSDKPQDICIARLINEDVYKAAYAVHDGNMDTLGTQRHFFSEEWANMKKILHYQPLDDIKNYFGVKFALYFAWLGFYTTMLIPAALVGILCMIYGWWTLNSDSPTNEICNDKSNIIMCPQCDKYCDYWKIIDACTYAKVTHLFDNYGTVFFGLFMSIWSALYVELWKRYSAEITHKWGLTGFDLDAQHPRPEYLVKYSNYKKKFNAVTNQEEPAVPFCKIKLPAMVLSFSLALLWVLLALAAVFAVIIYRMAGLTTNFILNDKSKSLNSIVVSVTAGVINLACITILNFLYERLAMILTKYEFHRTQVEFDDSLTLKIYMFQFVNFYSSLFYIGFLKGKFVGYPKVYNRIFGFRQEECSLGGCMMELFMQLAIIMIGKQALNNFIEIGIPMITSKKSCNKTPEKYTNKTLKQWVDDYVLLTWDSKGMFYEYLEMVIQYGFVTLFVTAFPLAPVFAFINNIIEMRLDAKKYLKYYRRPTVQRVKDIGIWFYIIEALGKISIVSNAFVIAFCSNYIPRMVYSARNLNSEEKFLNFSLSVFDVKDFDNRSVPLYTSYGNISECYYSDYRNPHWYLEEMKYNLNMTHWHILAARLAFIVVYQNVVTIIVMLVQWAIPDIPKKLKNQIKREALRTSDYIIQQETKLAKEKRKRL